MRPRELWFSLAGALLAVGTILSALALGYYAKERHYSLSFSPLMIGAYACFALVFLSFALAIAGWGPWLRWQRFPDITVLVEGVMQSEATRQVVGRQAELMANIHVRAVEIVETRGTSAGPAGAPRELRRRLLRPRGHASWPCSSGG